MKRATVLSFALLFVSSLGIILVSNSLAAQNAGSQPAQALLHAPPANTACPVSIRAQQASDGDMLAVDHSRPSHPKGIAQRLHLTLTYPDSRRITRATVTIHGLTPRSRVTRTFTTHDDSDAARTVDVTFPGGPRNAVSAYLWVPGLSAVSTIDLNAVTFADGSTWKLSSGGMCHAQVDGLMLISNK